MARIRNAERRQKGEERARIMVELVGLEPTTSSLRILTSAQDAATPKKPE
jgi:hypothetical protein